MRVYYHPAVEAESREIQRYYEERCPGLGVQFLDEFERQVLALAATPERWMVVTADIRRCLMRRFPYVIWNQVRPGASGRTLSLGLASVLIRCCSGTLFAAFEAMTRSIKITAHNAGWRTQFPFAGSGSWPGMCEFYR